MLQSFHHFPFYSYCYSNYQNSNSCYSILLLKVIAISFPLLFSIAFKIAIVGIAITIWRAIEKSSHESMYKEVQLLLLQSWKSANLMSNGERNESFDRVPKIILYFGGTNNIFSHCILYLTSNSLGLYLRLMWERIRSYSNLEETCGTISFRDLYYCL